MANGNKYEYKFDLFFITHSKKEYEARMLCIKIYSKYDMGGPPKVIVTDDEGAINNGGLVQK